LYDSLRLLDTMSKEGLDGDVPEIKVRAGRGVGTAGTALVDIIYAYQRVLVIDAIQGKDTLPPRSTLLKPHELNDVEEDMYSAHDMDLTETLELMKALSMDIPDISIVGIPATDIKPLIGLPEECKPLIEDAVDQVIRMIEERP
jgi:hydrogenase maturation protease